MCIACCIPKATNTHTEYVTFIAFPLQQWLRERASVLRYTYIACLVYLPVYIGALPQNQATFATNRTPLTIRHCVV